MEVVLQLRNVNTRSVTTPVGVQRWGPSGYAGSMFETLPGSDVSAGLPAGPIVDLRRHTAEALDWEVVLGALSACASTLAGQASARVLVASSQLDEVETLRAQVAEILALSETAERLPLGGCVDLSDMVARASRESVLDLDEVRELVGGVAAVDRLSRWLGTRSARVPALTELAGGLSLPVEFVSLCEEAIDSDGDLSARRWPELGTLRNRVRELARGIRSRLDELVRGDELADHLQDRFVTQRGGRFVVPLKSSAPRHLGIVHATSNTGETVFLEPGEIVARSNRWRETQAELERTERRVLAEISAAVAAAGPALKRAQVASVELDLVQARGVLGERMRGRLLPCGSGGVLRLRQARHPVLVLRGIDVVPNDLALGPQHPCLVLTGPNTGGKTVALKTMGLAALFCRAGIPFPALDGSRVDLFPSVVADVGDIQTVEGDLSTFSGHIAVMKATLRAARRDTLVLLDEVGVGTDPAQGAPLARAILEALVDTGARVAATTHYAEVKALSAADERFSIAAMQYAHGRPTYRVAPGHAGQSHAFAIARHLQLPAQIIDRARELMDAGNRQIGDLLEQLEAQQAEVSMLQDALVERERVIAERERRYEARKQSLEVRKRRLETEIAERFTRRLREREAEVKALIAALQDQPDLDLAGRSLRQIREIRADISARTAPKVVAAPPPPKTIKVGDRVMVRSLQQRGVITEVFGRERYQVKVGALSMKLKRVELARIDTRGQVVAVAAVARSDSSRPRASRPTPPRAPAPTLAPARKKPVPKAPRESLQGLRMDFNTLDLRGTRVDEGIDQLGEFLDRMTLEGRAVAFVLHGHGTGALKKAVRQWLPKSGYVRAWRPCDPGEGGDAFTIVGLN